MSHPYTAATMARPKGDEPPREYVNARIRKDLFDELNAATNKGNPSRSQAIEQAVEMWLASKRTVAGPKRPPRRK